MAMDHHLTLLKLRRGGINYYQRAREALYNVDNSLRRNDYPFAKFIISNFIFDNKPRINDTQEVILVGILLIDYFIWDDPVYSTLLHCLVDNSNANKKSFLKKFIMTALAIGNIPALNISANLLLDPNKGKMHRTLNNFGSDLIWEIIYFSFNFTASFRILTTLPYSSPLMTHAIYIITAENFKNQLLPPNLRDLYAIWLSYTPKPYLFSIFIRENDGLGSFLLYSFCKYIILNEMSEKNPSYSTIHLRIIECLTNEQLTLNAKKVIDAFYFLKLVSIIQEEVGSKTSKQIEDAVDKLAQHVQVAKPFLFGNITLLFSTMKLLPQTALSKVVLKN